MKQEFSEKLSFNAISGKVVAVDFDGGDITSDAGFLLLSKADDVLGLTRSMVSTLEEWRVPDRIVHKREEMLKQRILSIGAGYADCNDQSTLRHDPALKIACDKRPQSDGALASQPTLSRFDNQPTNRSLLKLALAQGRCIIASLPADTRHVLLDVDATDDAAYGDQQLVMFNGYYGHRCYCPQLLHITPDDGKQRPLAALLRAGNAGATVGLRFMLRKAVVELRRCLPDLQITLRGDAAFGTAEVLGWCKQLKIDYVLGLRGNARLYKMSESVQVRAAVRHRFGDNRVFDEIQYQARSWGESERVVIKSQVQGDAVRTRYVVTSLALDKFDGDEIEKANTPASAAKRLYEYYCGRGEQENRIKELKLDLESGRTSCSSYTANQFRLSLHLAACMLWNVIQQGLRRIEVGRFWANSQVGSLRCRLLKVGARIVESSRRVVVHIASSYPHAKLWHQLFACLHPAPG